MSKTKKALIIGGGIAGPVAAIALKRAGIDAEVYEARSESMDHSGAFLNLAPNGVNALKTLGLAERVAADGFPSNAMLFFSGSGKQLGQMDSTTEEQRYGASNLMLKRGLLHKALREAAQAENVPLHFGKRLANVTVTAAHEVIAHFEDGSTAHGDLLIGGDGLHSRTRQIVLPSAPQPQYTGLIDCGGFGHCPSVAPGAQHMIFGKRAFFGYIARPDGEVYWFSNVAQAKEPTRDELRSIRDDEWKARLLALHKDDPAPVLDIIRSTNDSLGKWGTYDIPFLPTWHHGPICLIGDAAHATSPHIGQGASLALEDAVVLAQCLRDLPSVEQAFAAFERLRKPRVETLIKQARRMGNRKTPHPLVAWFRDLLLPFFLKGGTSQLAPVYSYRLNWNEKIA
ncbi:MAG: FAD-dependent monooxygenase [Chloroflexi bacterium]|nr:FAD-dependent monooxygenase [Chloroflexota bacterium]